MARNTNDTMQFLKTYYDILKPSKITTAPVIMPETIKISELLLEKLEYDAQREREDECR